MFEETFVLIRGKCFKMKDFYQISPDEMDKISLIIKPIGSTFIGNSRFQEQVVVYSNERKKYVPFFPRFYIYGNNQNILKFNKYVYYLLDNNNQCNPNRNYEGLSLCYIDYWLKTKLHDPYNCTLFYMGYKNWKMCDPIIILKNYEKIMSVALDNVKCLQACTYEEIRTEFFSKHLNYALNGTKNKKDYRIRVEFSYLKMKNYVYQEVSKLTISGYISELGGYTGLFIDLNIISLLLAAFIMIKYIYKKFLKIKIDRRIGIGI
uniref:Transmembrane protein n=1 Tax=Strongyloides venezuelensis TaxID=75913 RepID=A0A0K0FVE8_STRVS